MIEHLILTAIPWVNYYSHFTDKETEAQRLVMSWQKAVRGAGGLGTAGGSKGRGPVSSQSAGDSSAGETTGSCGACCSQSGSHL